MTIACKSRANVVRCAWLAAAATIALSCAAPAMAQSRPFDVPAQPAIEAVSALARQAEAQILLPGRIARGVRTNTVTGDMTIEQALQKLLAGTGLSAQKTGARTWTIVRNAAAVGNVPAAGVADEQAALAGQEGGAEITVTGTRIRGATTPSPVIQLTREQVRDAGFTELGQVIRSIPQNFSGGQNPGIGLGAGGINNQNISSGSALNLRGLGPDATLTLLNGRRMSYNGFVQAVDVSVIPVGALDRIEIVADGASAIYGSDAVAGVANIILRRDFDGVDATARFGLPTDGGGEQYQLGATAGTTWASGGLIAGYEYTDARAIFADQRSYTGYMPDPNLIYPSRRQHSAIVNLHQGITDFLEFSVDGLYTHRASRTGLSSQPAQFVRQAVESTVYAVSPSLKARLPGDWSVTLGGNYSRDKTEFDASYSIYSINRQIDSRGCYCNESHAVEIDAEGPLFHLPGGDLRVAVGAGYRRSDFDYISYTRLTRESGRRSSRYAFGELSMPLVGPGQGISGINRLTATAALRYEDYGDTGSITTPKLGLIYEPIPDLSLRASWGRSFKAPTLLQQYSESIVYLMAIDEFAGVNYPPGSTVLMSYGGNRNLKPERAETWSTTVSIHPRALSGLRMELSYFNVDYRDRVVQPITFTERAFVDPAYRQFLTLGPSAAAQGDLIAASATGITYNSAGEDYDPAKVVALLHNLYTNAARSKVSGVDLTASYAFDLGAGHARLSGSATWLKGSQQNSTGEPAFRTVGLVFNPPKFSARGGLVWNRGGLTLAGFVNHVGSVTDDTQAPPAPTGSFTTVDANLRYRTDPGRSILSDVELGLSIQNLFDRSPPRMTPIVDYVVNYDSTNYSAIGRFVSLSVTKHW
ncbi:MAG: TonB-dependent receptor domain-containing protein [Sphingobium sp.]